MDRRQALNLIAGTDAHFRSFANNLVPKLVEQGIGVSAMRTMGSGIILKSNTVTPLECLHYALNLPTSVVITGDDSIKMDQYPVGRDYPQPAVDGVKS